MIQPVQIVEESDSELKIVWSDDKENVYVAADLRRKCPCAGCVNEWTGERMLKADTVPDNVTFTNTSVVGRYALNFHFSDGHETGIFSFKYLREIGEGDGPPVKN
jgi:DUF971 family protein